MRDVVCRAKSGDRKAQAMVFQYVLGGGVTKVTNNTLVMPPDIDSTDAAPGSIQKLQELGRRASNGQSLHHPDDARG